MNKFLNLSCGFGSKGLNDLGLDQGTVLAVCQAGKFSLAAVEHAKLLARGGGSNNNLGQGGRTVDNLSSAVGQGVSLRSRLSVDGGVGDLGGRSRGDGRSRGGATREDTVEALSSGGRGVQSSGHGGSLGEGEVPAGSTSTDECTDVDVKELLSLVLAAWVSGDQLSVELCKVGVDGGNSASTDASEGKLGFDPNLGTETEIGLELGIANADINGESGSGSTITKLRLATALGFGSEGKEERVVLTTGCLRRLHH